MNWGTCSYIARAAIDDEGDLYSTGRWERRGECLYELPVGPRPLLLSMRDNERPVDVAEFDDWRRRNAERGV